MKNQKPFTSIAVPAAFAMPAFGLKPMAVASAAGAGVEVVWQGTSLTRGTDARHPYGDPPWKTPGV